MRPIKFNVRMYLLAGILAAVGAILMCAAITLFSMHLNFDKGTPFVPDSKQEQENDGEETPAPEISVPSSLSIDILDNSTIYEYTTSNLGEYEVSLSVVDESVLTLDGDVIKPKNLGTTKIVVSINTTPATTKETTVTIVDCVREVEFVVTNLDYSPITTFYTNTQYILEIKQNILTSTNPNIYYDNICNLELLNTSTCSYFFSFEVLSAGNFSFKYEGKYVELEKQYFAYKLPTNFDVSFSNMQATSNIIQLSLFNLNYSTDANADGKYNQTVYEIIPESGTIDNIVLSSDFDDSVIYIQNNTITALKEGSTSLTFTSTISGISKTYTIEVTSIYARAILINGQETSLGASLSISLNTNESYPLSYSILPIYALGELILEYDSNLVSYEDGSLSLITSLEATIKLLYNGTSIFDLTLSQKPSITHSISVISATQNAELSNLTLTVSTNSYIQLQVLAIDSYTNETLDNQDFTLTIQDQTICKWLDDKVTNGKISLQILTSGSTTLCIVDVTNGVSIEITIEVIG